MPIRRNYVNVKSDGKYRLENNTPISTFDNTGTANGLLDMISRETEKTYDEVEYLHSIMDPTKTVGRELDNLGFIFGNSRSNTVTAADFTTTNFYFYLDPRTGLSIGTLLLKLYPTSTHYNVRKRMEDQGFIDSANNPTQLSIPAGTLIANSDSSITYVTVDNVSLTNSSNEVYSPVVATVEGAGANVESNVLVKHNINQYDVLRDLSKYILCSNRYPISNGKAAASDNEYRYNLTLERINYGLNEVSVRQSALSVPGVRNIQFERGRYGNGTFNVIVEGTSPIVSEGLLDVVKQRLATQVTNSDNVYVQRPEYLGIELNFEIIAETGSDLNSIREQARNDVISYINDLDVGGTIVWNEIISIIMGIDGVQDFILSYFKLGEYDVFNKINKNQIILKASNQRANTIEKFYTDAGLVSVCCRQQG